MYIQNIQILFQSRFGTADYALDFFIFRVKELSPLWSSDQSFWLHIQMSGFDSRRYQIFLDVVDLKRGPLSLLSTIEELLERKRSGSGLENRDYCHGESAALISVKSWH
jgi:hypothetical protein